MSKIWRGHTCATEQKYTPTRNEQNYRHRELDHHLIVVVFTIDFEQTT